MPPIRGDIAVLRNLGTEPRPTTAAASPPLLTAGCSTGDMVQPGPDPDNYPPIDPSEPIPDDGSELSSDTPETLPPAPVEPMPGPDDPDSVPV
jgi:hypothetical protein